MSEQKFLRKYSDIENGRDLSPSIYNKEDNSDIYISEGGYANVYKTTLKLDNNKDITLVKKEYKNPSFQSSIERQLKIHDLLKKSKIKTFNTLRTDGVNLYSTPLNNDEFITLSHNNKSPMVLQGSEFKQFNEKIEISNLDEVADTIIDFSFKSSIFDIGFSSDCLFFMLKKDIVDSNKFKIDLLIGDLDSVNINNQKHNEIIINNLVKLETSLNTFIEKYVAYDKIESYLIYIKNKLNPSLKENEVFTQHGIKNILDYKNVDGLILDGEVVIHSNYSLENVLKIVEIKGITTDFTECSQEIKDKITSINGSFIDNSNKVIYSNLTTIYGNLNSNNADTVMMQNLVDVAGNIYIENIRNLDFSNLKNIGGYIVFSDCLKRIKINNDIKVSRIIFEHTEFKNFHDFIEFVKLEKSNIEIVNC